MCLEFSPGIEAFGGKKTGHFCNKLVEYKAEAAKPYVTKVEAESGVPVTPGKKEPGAYVQTYFCAN